MSGAIASMKAIDPLTIEFKTKSPTPEFIEQVGLVYIVQKKLAEGKTIEAFNDRSAAIGTGRLQGEGMGAGRPHHARPQRQVLGQEARFRERHDQVHRQ